MKRYAVRGTRYEVCGVRREAMQVLQVMKVGKS